VNDGEIVELVLRAPFGHGNMSAYLVTSGLVEIEIQAIRGKGSPRRTSVSYTLDVTEAVRLADWLNAFIKTQQDAYAASLEVQP